MTYPFNQIPSTNPQNIGIPTPIGLQTANRDPNALDNTYVPGSEWQNNVTKMFWKCQSSTIAGAVWIPFGGSSTGTVVSLTGNSGGAVPPDGVGNINVVGDGIGITIAGNPGTNTLTASLVGGGIPTQTYTTNVAGPVSPTGAGVINVNASTSTYTDGGTANTIKIEVQGTDHAVFIGNGTQVPASTIPVGSNGQVLIGATAADPAFATLTSSDSSITYVTGANSLDLTVTGGSTVGKTITGNSGGPISPTAGNWNTLGTGSITIAGAGSTLTTQLTGLTNHNVLIGAGTATITKVAPSATSGIPLISQGAAADPAFGTAVVAGGGTGATSFTAYAVICGGTTSTNPLQNVSGVGTSGQVLTSNGAGSLPTWQGLVNPTGISNLGISYSGSTFSVTGANAALSGSNIGYVTIQSKTTPGSLVTISITADQTFIDDTGASTIAGNLFGFTTTDTTASNDVPFFIYAVLNDAETAISFMVGRTAGMSTSPIAANIGKTGSAVADVSFAFFALSNPTVADYESNSCLMIGSFRMRLTTAPGDWTVQALSFTDGMGRFQQGISFQLPTGVLGASASTHWQPNGGTAPVFNGATYYYFIDPTGFVTAQYGATTISGNGAGAVFARLIVPLPNALATANDYVGGGRYESTAPSFQISLMCFSTSDYTEIAFVDATNGNSGVLTNANLGVGNTVATFRTQMLYNAEVS